MKQYYANQQNDSNGVTHYIITDNNTAVLNFLVNLGDQATYQILLAASKGDEFHHIGRYNQFVGYLRCDKGMGISMMLSDYKNNIDLGLDEYTTKMQNGWEKQDRDAYINIIKEIKDSPMENALITVIPAPFSLLQ